MTELLPIGTVVDVTEPAYTYTYTTDWGTSTKVGPHQYRGRVEGYDLHGSKYHLAVHLNGEHYTQPLAWAFPSWCTPVAPDPSVGQL